MRLGGRGLPHCRRLYGTDGMDVDDGSAGSGNTTWAGTSVATIASDAAWNAVGW